MAEVERSRLPVACPNLKCGAVGWIPVNRLDRQLVCRTCGTRFYMDSVVSEMKVGERPEKFEDPLKIAPPPKIRPNIIEKAEKRWRRLPPKARAVVQTSAMGIVIVGLSVWIYASFFIRGPKLPKSLGERALYVMKAFARNQREPIVFISAPETVGDIKQWMVKARPPTWPRSIITPIFTVKIVNQNPKAGKAVVQVDMEAPGVAAMPGTEKVGRTQGGPQVFDPPPDVSKKEEESPQSIVQGDPNSGEPPPITASPSSGQTEGAAPTGEEEPVIPEPPKILKVTLYWVYRDDAWVLDASQSLKSIP